MILPLETRIGTYSGSDINNVIYSFNKANSASVNSLNTELWVAATTHNCVQEHIAYASQLGFGRAPAQLKFLLTNMGQAGSASTPMFNKRGVPSLSTDWALMYITNNPNAIAGGLAALAGVVAGQLDIAYPYAYSDFSRLTSDEIAETMYHELSHASHYNKLGNAWYGTFSDALIAEIIAYPSGNNNPYGPANSANAPIIALGEGWAYHMGHYLADLKYGAHASCQSEQAPYFCPNGTSRPHLDVLEYFNPNLPGDPFAWIPKGIMLDLIDASEVSGTTAVDGVSGYSNQQIFNALDSDVKSPAAFRDRLLQENGNSQMTQVVTLFQSYGYY
jgi:hypothetical protein